jgi:hypothetical protein
MAKMFGVLHKIRVQTMMVPRVRRVAADDKNRTDCGET